MGTSPVATPYRGSAETTTRLVNDCRPVATSSTWASVIASGTFYSVVLVGRPAPLYRPAVELRPFPNHGITDRRQVEYIFAGDVVLAGQTCCGRAR